MILASQVVKEGYVFVVSTDYEYFMGHFQKCGRYDGLMFQLFQQNEKESSIKTRLIFMTSPVYYWKGILLIFHQIFGK